MLFDTLVDRPDNLDTSLRRRCAELCVRAHPSAGLDPVATGAVASLARPGGNVTGFTAIQADLTGKRLELLKELLPQLATVAFLVRATSPATAQYEKEAEAVARALGIQLLILAVIDPQELESAFKAAQGASALRQVGDAMLTAHRTRIGELALKSRLPSISELRETAYAGGLMSYGPHYGDLYGRAAKQVHAILKGAKPADLPVEQPTRLELVINLKTENALGLTVPLSLLARSDEVIEKASGRFTGIRRKEYDVGLWPISIWSSPGMGIRS
ncbi:MAG: ABC transporter substrate-binding protein [Hyphomicrobiaceae bacterium]